MSVYVGSYSIGEIYVGSTKIVKAYVGSTLVYQTLPTKTFRFRFSSSSFVPSTTLASSDLTWTAVDASSGIWDATSIKTGSTPYNNLFTSLLNTSNMGSVTCDLIAANTSDMIRGQNLFSHCNALTSVCKMNLTNATHVSSMFSDCSKLTDVPDMNLDSAIYASGMFSLCTLLQRVPNLGQLPNITRVDNMFNACYNVESGALAMYNILSTRITTATYYRYCFRDCGSNTTTGAAELAQIPSDWK